MTAKAKTKKFRVQIELTAFEVHVSARTQIEARKKALGKLSKKNPANMIHRDWPGNKKVISIDEV